MTSGGTGVSVIVPTYRRPEFLRQCLLALRAQSVEPDEIVVVRRADDVETTRTVEVLRDGKIDDVVVHETGVIAAMAAGARVASGRILAFVDDDAVARRDWLQRLLPHFDDPHVGGVGGRDIQADEYARLPLTDDVGRVGRWGKMRGNHHLGTGPPRDVMILKGANMAFRREAMAFPAGLRGRGAEAHFEVAMCLWALGRNWRIVYDPTIVVDHLVGPRFDGERRGQPGRKAVADAAYNYVAALLSGRPELLWRRAAYGMLVGDRGAPGLVRAAVALSQGDPEVVRRLPPSLAGQGAAVWRSLRGHRVWMAPLVEATSRRLPTVALVAHEVHDRGGMEHAVAQLIRLGHRRVRFVVVSRQLAPDLRPLVDWHPVRVPARPFPLKFGLFFLIAGARLAHLRADVVHTMGAIVPNKATVATVHFCHAAFREAVREHSVEPIGGVRRLNTRAARLLSLAVERYAYDARRVALLAAVSSGVRAELERHYPDMPVVTTPNGLDLGRFRPDPASRRTLRDEQSVRAEEVVVLFVGGDWERKGLAELIEGFAAARSLCRAKTHLWIVGEGDRRRYAELAQRYDLTLADFTFFGPRNDVERFYQAADVFVAPTLYETFCLAAHEAASCALPVVGTAVSGLAELLGANDSGLRVERSAEAVAGAIAKLADDPGLRRRLGASGRARTESLSWSQSVETVLDTYSTLLHVPDPSLQPA